MNNDENKGLSVTSDTLKLVIVPDGDNVPSALGVSREIADKIEAMLKPIFEEGKFGIPERMAQIWNDPLCDTLGAKIFALYVFTRICAIRAGDDKSIQVKGGIIKMSGDSMPKGLKKILRELLDEEDDD